MPRAPARRRRRARFESDAGTCAPVLRQKPPPGPHRRSAALDDSYGCCPCSCFRKNGEWRRCDLTPFAGLADGGCAALIRSIRAMPERHAAENGSRLIESERTLKIKLKIK